VIASACHY